jgi:hypothetical protein
MNGGQIWEDDDPNGPKLAPAILRKAADEYERAVREDLHR